MYRLIRITVYFAYCIVLGGLPAYTQDITNLGGDLTTTIPGANALQVNAPNVIDPVRRQQQLDGFEPFHQIFTKQEGLGPNFVHVSCGKCHVQNGRGRVKIVDKRRRREAMVIKVSLQGLDDTGAPINIPTLGIDQLQPSRLNGKRRFRTRLRWSKVPGSYPDGTKYKLRAPRLRFRIRGVKRKAVASSLRATPPLVGLGLLEAIKESDILALSCLLYTSPSPRD